MGASALMLAGVAVFFNIAVIYYKYMKGQTANASLDAAILAGVMYVFSGTLGALVIGTIASSLFSMFLIVKPPPEDFFENF